MAVQREADLCQQMLTAVVRETGNAGDQALGRGKERPLQGHARVRQLDVVPDKDVSHATDDGPRGTGTLVPSD